MRTLLASSLALVMTAACATDSTSPMMDPEPDPTMPTQSIGITAPATARLIRGQTASVIVTVSRDGYDGDVTVSTEDLPAGVTAAPLVIPAGQSSGTLALSCATGVALATYATLTIHASAGTLDATAPLDVHLTDAPGAADITFAITGKKAYGFNAASAEMADAAAIAPDGKIVVAGRDSTANGFVLVRLLENGDLDPDFGTGGVVAISDGGVSLLRRPKPMPRAQQRCVLRPNAPRS